MNARGLVVLLALATSACQTLPPPAPHAAGQAPPATPAPMPATPPPEPFRNVYTQEQDSAPPPAEGAAVDYAAIPDAVPQEEPRGRYGNKSPYKVLGKTYRVMDSARGYSEEGTASWYGKKFHGHRTSSFERYDMYAMTAAHKTLPIPTYVRVTNLDNGKEVVVRVNDRGPFHSSRLIDLSWAAAQKLDYIGRGTARVRVEAIAAPSTTAAATNTAAAPTVPADSTATAVAVPAPPPPDVYYVQLGAYAFPDKARELGEQARGTIGDPVRVAPGEDLVFRVRVGPYPDRAAAERARDALVAAGIGSPALVLAPP